MAKRVRGIFNLNSWKNLENYHLGENTHVKGMPLASIKEGRFWFAKVEQISLHLPVSSLCLALRATVSYFLESSVPFCCATPQAMSLCEHPLLPEQEAVVCQLDNVKFFVCFIKMTLFGNSILICRFLDRTRTFYHTLKGILAPS